MPHCRTLEEMRALRCGNALPIECHRNGGIGGGIGGGSSTTVTTTTSNGATSVVTTTTTSAPPSPLCDFYPYVCHAYRPPSFWCRLCTHRRLFPELSSCCWAPPQPCVPPPPLTCPPRCHWGG